MINICCVFLLSINCFFGLSLDLELGRQKDIPTLKGWISFTIYSELVVLQCCILFIALTVRKGKKKKHNIHKLVEKQ